MKNNCHANHGRMAAKTFDVQEDSVGGNLQQGQIFTRMGFSEGIKACYRFCEVGAVVCFSMVKHCANKFMFGCYTGCCV